MWLVMDDSLMMITRWTGGSETNKFTLFLQTLQTQLGENSSTHHVYILPGHHWEHPHQLCRLGTALTGNRKAPQRIVNTAGKNIGATLPSLQDLYTRFTRQETMIVCVASHSAHTVRSASSPQGEGPRASMPAPPALLTASYTRLARSWTLSTLSHSLLSVSSQTLDSEAQT